jgi:hypothetical protein
MNTITDFQKMKWALAPRVWANSIEELCMAECHHIRRQQFRLNIDGQHLIPHQVMASIPVWLSTRHFHMNSDLCFLLFHDNSVCESSKHYSMPWSTVKSFSEALAADGVDLTAGLRDFLGTPAVVSPSQCAITVRHDWADGYITEHFLRIQNGPLDSFGSVEAARNRILELESQPQRALNPREAGRPTYIATPIEETL